MTIGHATAATAEQLFVSICKEKEFFESYTCNGLGKALHESLEMAIDVGLPVLMQGTAAPLNLNNIGKGVAGSFSGSYLAEQLFAPAEHHHHELDWCKIGITTAIGVGAAFALPTGFAGAAIIAGTTTATGHLYDYIMAE